MEAAVEDPEEPQLRRPSIANADRIAAMSSPLLSLSLSRGQQRWIRKARHRVMQAPLALDARSGACGI
jgi:hypothetical protein